MVRRRRRQRRRGEGWSGIPDESLAGAPRRSRRHAGAARSGARCAPSGRGPSRGGGRCDRGAARRARVRHQRRGRGLLADQAEDLLLLALPLSGDDLIGLFGLAGAAPREGAARIVAEALSSLERSDAIESGNPARSGSNDPAAARRERRSAFLRGIALAIRAELADDPADRHLAYRADAIGALREETRASRDAAIATLSPLLIDLEPTARRLAQVHVAARPSPARDASTRRTRCCASRPRRASAPAGCFAPP
ncbi:MAG: hypothetical protein U0575_15935 [Phycisphaerales bacterium]